MVTEEGRTCNICEKFQSWDNFPTRSDRPGKRRTVCRDCKKLGQRRRYAKHKETNFFRWKTTVTKSRSQKLRVPFDLDPEYLESIWTGFCPITGQQLDMITERTSESAAELDRFKPELGYIKGNVHFLSRKMNRIKNNVDIEELRNLIKWMETVDNDPN